MFKWLADMLVKTPVQGTCSCCEGKKQRLQKMQEAIERGEVDENAQEDTSDCGSGCCCGGQEYASKILGPIVTSNYPPEVHNEANCDKNYCDREED